jgi:hypothetical protein
MLRLLLAGRQAHIAMSQGEGLTATLCVVQAGAAEKELPLYKYIAELAGNKKGLVSGRRAADGAGRACICWQHHSAVPSSAHVHIMLPQLILPRFWLDVCARCSGCQCVDDEGTSSWMVLAG